MARSECRAHSKWPFGIISSACVVRDVCSVHCRLFGATDVNSIRTVKGFTLCRKTFLDTVATLEPKRVCVDSFVDDGNVGTYMLKWSASDSYD